MTKVSELTELSAVSTDDIFLVTDAPAGSAISKKITAANLFGAPLAIGVTTPNTGAFTTLAATTYNKVTITAPATGATLTLGEGSTLDVAASKAVNIDDDVTIQGAVTVSAELHVEAATHVDQDLTKDATVEFATVKTDHISEINTGHGVAVDGVTLKDGGALVITGGTNTFNLTNGTSSLDIAAGKTVNIDDDVTVAAELHVEAATHVNQDLTSDASPTFVTVKCSGLTDLKVPKHVADATGLADTTINVTANNEMTNPSQPAFLVTSNGANNVTGDGTEYTVVWDNEIYDQNADFAANTFTAPVTGRYQFNVTVGLSGLASGFTTHYLEIVTSNRTYVDYRTFSSVSYGYYTMSFSTLADMDAGDTTVIKVAVYGGTKTIHVENYSYTFFSGFLAC